MIWKRPTFINSKEDLDWLRDTHGRAIVPDDARSAVLYGNEDCPEHFEWFSTSNPHYLAKPCGSATLNEQTREYRPDESPPNP